MGLDFQTLLTYNLCTIVGINMREWKVFRDT